MKKFIIILILFVSQNLFSQKYSFDYYYEYKFENKVTFYMINSKDSSYVFIGSNLYNPNTGCVWDYRNNVINYYELENIENAVNINYLYTRKFYGALIEKFDKKYQFENIVTTIDSVNESVKIIKFKQNRKKTKIGEIELIYNKNNSKYVFHNSALASHVHHFFDNRKIEIVNNRLPSSFIFYDRNGEKKCSVLSKIKEINTTLNLKSEDLKYIK